MIYGKTYDLKVGYTCNNHCKHCVIETNIDSLRKVGKKIDTSYADLISEIKTKDFLDASTVVLTGGEITIRKDFMRIVKAILSEQPDKGINIQTNGRNLKPYLEELKSLSPRINYTIAVHSMDEATHNLIVGNKFDVKSPFVETMESIQEIIRVYGKFADNARIEIVLSRDNVHDFYNTVKELYNIGALHIGVSYPHLDGFFYQHGKDKVKEIGFSYKELSEVIPMIHKFTSEHPDLQMSFEEFPRCVWRDEEGQLLPILKNQRNLAYDGGDVSVKFPGQEINRDFTTIWNNMHKKVNACNRCEYSCKCPGIWEESAVTFGDVGLIPITKEEVVKMGGMNNICF